jgi:NTE family protein
MESLKNRPKIGLALGGGGSKGFAHIGIIKVLEENNIPIDYIAGTSIGALVGGLYAATKDIKAIEEMATGTNWKEMLSMADPSIKQGFFLGEKVKGWIDKNLAAKKFEETKIPFSAVATDLNTGDAVIFNEGDILEAIRSSISVPIVLKPVAHHKQLLSDGGLSLPVPVSVVHDMGADFIIAVNLENNYGKRDNVNLFNIAQNSLWILRLNLAKENIKTADIVLVPKVLDPGWEAFLTKEKAIEVIKQGEDVAREKLPEILAALEKQGHQSILGKIKNLLN